MNTKDTANTAILTPVARLSYPSLFKARAMQEGQELKYSAVLLFPKDADLKSLKQAVEVATAKKWPDAKKRPANLRSPFRDGDADRSGTEGYENVIFITASNKLRPVVVDQDVHPVLSLPITEDSIAQAEDVVYAGCYVKALVRAYAYDQKGNRGVAFSLEMLQKVKDGERFSGVNRSNPSEYFNPVKDEEENASILDQ